LEVAVIGLSAVHMLIFGAIVMVVLGPRLKAPFVDIEIGNATSSSFSNIEEQRCGSISRSFCGRRSFGRCWVWLVV
jgi:hypothetical protein